MTAPIQGHDSDARYEDQHDARPAAAPGDYWLRTCGVPWERISRAVQAVGQRNLRSQTARRDGAA